MDDKLKQARANHEAAAALYNAGCLATGLFVPLVAERLRIADDGTLSVVDDDGVLVQGGTPAMVAEQVKQEYTRTTGTKFFHRGIH